MSQQMNGTDGWNMDRWKNGQNTHTEEEGHFYGRLADFLCPYHFHRKWLKSKGMGGRRNKRDLSLTQWSELCVELACSPVPVSVFPRHYYDLPQSKTYRIQIVMD